MFVGVLGSRYSLLVLGLFWEDRCEASSPTGQHWEIECFLNKIRSFSEVILEWNLMLWADLIWPEQKLYMLGSENYTERETTGTTFTIIYEGHIYVKLTTTKCGRLHKNILRLFRQIYSVYKPKFYIKKSELKSILSSHLLMTLCNWYYQH